MKSNKSSSIDYQENDYVPVHSPDHSVKNSQKSQDRSFRSERRSNEEYKEEPSSVPYTSSDLYLKTSEGRESQHSENLSGCSDTESIVGTKIIPDMGFIANKFEQSRSFCYNYSRRQTARSIKNMYNVTSKRPTYNFDDNPEEHETEGHEFFQKYLTKRFS